MTLHQAFTLHHLVDTDLFLMWHVSIMTYSTKRLFYRFESCCFDRCLQKRSPLFKRAIAISYVNLLRLSNVLRLSYEIKQWHVLPDESELDWSDQETLSFLLHRNLSVPSVPGHIHDGKSNQLALGKAIVHPFALLHPC